MIWHVKDNLVNRHQGVGFGIPVTRESDMIVFLCDCGGAHSQCLSEYIGSAWSGNILTLLPLIWGFGKRISEGFWKSLRVQIVCQSRGQVQILFAPTGALYVTNKTMQLKFSKKCERDKSSKALWRTCWSPPMFFGCDDAILYYGKVKGNVEQAQIFLGW